MRERGAVNSAAGRAGESWRSWRAPAGRGVFNTVENGSVAQKGGDWSARVEPGYFSRLLISAPARYWLGALMN